MVSLLIDKAEIMEDHVLEEEGQLFF